MDFYESYFDLMNRERSAADMVRVLFDSAPPDFPVQGKYHRRDNGALWRPAHGGYPGNVEEIVEG